MFSGTPKYEDENGTRQIYKVQYKTVYTMAKQAAEDALAGEELFIANYDIENSHSDFDLL